MESREEPSPFDTKLWLHANTKGAVKDLSPFDTEL
jgi:hypothetical protein